MGALKKANFTSNSTFCVMDIFSEQTLAGRLSFARSMCPLCRFVGSLLSQWYDGLVVYPVFAVLVMPGDVSLYTSLINASKTVTNLQLLYLQCKCKRLFFDPLIRTNNQSNQIRPKPFHSAGGFCWFDASVPFSKGIASFASSAVAKTTAAVPFPWQRSNRSGGSRCQRNSLFCCFLWMLMVFPKSIL